MWRSIGLIVDESTRVGTGYTLMVDLISCYVWPRELIRVATYAILGDHAVHTFHLGFRKTPFEAIRLLSRHAALSPILIGFFYCVHLEFLTLLSFKFRETVRKNDVPDIDFLWKMTEMRVTQRVGQQGRTAAG